MPSPTAVRTGDAVREALATHRVVNLVGPLGVGKTSLVGALHLPGVLVVDGNGDGEPAGDSVLVVSRTPVNPPAFVVQADPWTDAEIAALTARACCPAPDQTRLVVALSGGIPLIAHAACRALRDGAPVDAAGPVADAAAEAVFDRLTEESPAYPVRHLLAELASVGAADEEQLEIDAPVFSALAALSVVQRSDIGLAVAEPFRSLFELAHGWRRPLAQRESVRRASEHVEARLAVTRDPRCRVSLVLNGIFLAEEPHVRAAIFPPRPASAPVRRATDADADAIDLLVRGWATRGDLDPRATERLLDQWIGSSTEHFNLALDRDGEPKGVSYIVPFADAERAQVDQVLQQHTERFLTDDPTRDGVFVMCASWERPELGAAVLRHVLSSALVTGEAVICTPTVDYQRLVLGLGFAAHGGTRDEIYGRGHRPLVFSQAMQAGDLGTWLQRLRAVSGLAQEPDRLTAYLSDALTMLRTGRDLGRSPLLVAGATSTPALLRAWLTDAVDRIEANPDTARAEAGHVLAQYYLGRAKSHLAVASRLHLSRATYFRRLNHGLSLLAELFAATAATP